MAIVSTGSRDWAEDAVDEPWLVERGLSELNWDQGSIAQFIAEYLELKASDLGRPTVVDRIREMLGRRQIIEEDVATETVRVPLYRFSAPRAQGASVAFSEGQTFFEGGFWMLKIFGMGTADSQSLEVATVNTYVANNGECKMVFVPVRLRIARVRVEDAGIVIGHGVRAQVIPPQGRDPSFVRGRGCMTLPRRLCRGGIGETPEEDFVFEHSKDTGTAPHSVRRSWAMNVDREISLQLKAADVEVGPVTRIRRVRQMGLEISLPPGNDYLGFRAPGGVWWEAP
jgi:hypothetical protein